MGRSLEAPGDEGAPPTELEPGGALTAYASAYRFLGAWQYLTGVRGWKNRAW